jgi:ribosomal subunit interface protein
MRCIASDDGLFFYKTPLYFQNDGIFFYSLRIIFAGYNIVAFTLKSVTRFDLNANRSSTSMTIKITGKNLDLGESLRSYASERVGNAVGKYASRSLSGQLSVEKNQDRFVTNCAIHLASGLDMQSSGEGHDAYVSVDAAVERLEKRLRRYKRRLKSHGQNASVSAPGVGGTGIDYVIDAEHALGDDAGSEPTGAPAVIAEMPARVRAMSVSDAVMQMDLADQAFLVFRNATHGGVNVVYRRADGNIGWIDPAGVVAAG